VFIVAVVPCLVVSLRGGVGARALLEQLAKPAPGGTSGNPPTDATADAAAIDRVDVAEHAAEPVQE